jgi:hypothetical protein
MNVSATFTRLAGCGAASVVFSAAALAAAIPAAAPGKAIEARLLTPLSSYATKSGAAIEAMIATPLCGASGDEWPRGAILAGRVSKVHRVGLGIVHETAGMKIVFNRLILSDGRSYDIDAKLTGIENSRERVDRKGGIHGIRATASLSNRAGQHILLAALNHPALILPLLIVENSLFHFPEPEFEFHTGSALRMTVDFPQELGPLAGCPLARNVADSEIDSYHHIVDALPYWSYSVRQPQPIDLVNIVFIGSEDEINRAFSAAGWLGSRPNSTRAGIKAIRAIAEQHPLADAPMRNLLLDNKEPDIRLQKSLDTFEKRDHLRVWRREEALGGRDVWASAATRDIAATFGIKPFGFTHQIEDNVDLERDQVVTDLIYTECVDSVAYISRPETVRTSGEAFRRGVATDSRVAVVTLNGCIQPELNPSDDKILAKPGKVVRFVRRVTLTARNHFLRDNIVWRGAEATRMTVDLVRGWNQQWKNESYARKLDSKMADSPDLRRDFVLR